MLKYNPVEVEYFLKTEIYTNFNSLQEELDKRWNDVSLRKKVASFFGDDVISHVLEKQYAFQNKYIFSPNKELDNFINLSDVVGLEKCLLEYNGKFVSKNIEKYFLCKMYFTQGLNKNNTDIFISERIVDFNKYEGEHMKNIDTLWGENLVDFHHKLVDLRYPGLSKKIISINEWFDRNNNIEGEWYTAFLALFVVNGILFENYLPEDPEENVFIMEKLKPSLLKIKEIFGVTPLILPAVPVAEGSDVHWRAYDYFYKDSIKTMLEKEKKQDNISLNYGI